MSPLNVLGQKGNPNVITAMRALLEDAQPEVRAAALNAGLLIAEDQQIITERYEALEHARFERLRALPLERLIERQLRWAREGGVAASAARAAAAGFPYAVEVSRRSS